MPSPWIHRLAGSCLLLTACALAAGLAGHLAPDGSPLSTVLRMLDSLRPHLLALAALGGVGLACLGLRRTGLACLLAAMLGGGLLILDYRARALPISRDPGAGLTVLWFNLKKDNPVPPARLEAALRASDADVIVLSEALPARAAKPALRTRYPHQAGCASERACELLILSRHPIGALQLFDTFAGPGRFASFELCPEGAARVRIVALHRIKPWYLGMTGMELSWIDAVLARAPQRPLIVMGDFNAAPWSRSLRSLEQAHGLRHPPRPIATWPRDLGDFGLPIDHVLLRGVAGFHDIMSWGEDLGSNHRGLLARIALPSEAPPRRPRKASEQGLTSPCISTGGTED